MAKPWLSHFNSGATEKACENDEHKSPFTDLERFDGELRLLLDEAIADRADYNSFRFTISEEQPSLDDKGHEIPRGGDPCVLEHRAT